jgi:hypothetical protein|uniref:Uncharacterized protein n=1 Tax=Siphoviridae sp. ct2ZW1 TaxID=2825316 RepID=A0A8S5Q8D7_9CAUD|nr:MAG TPA: hypothetical protein [Siphoviridae sp. ct2ZW1]
MKKLEFNKRIELETSNDVTLSIQASRMQITDSDGTYEMDAEVVLLIEDEERDNEIVTILSTDNIDKMIEQLRTLNEKVKAYNKAFKEKKP